MHFNISLTKDILNTVFVKHLNSIWLLERKKTNQGKKNENWQLPKFLKIIIVQLVH